MLLPDKMLLYAVTDRSWLGTHSLANDVESAIIGGATMIQLREKELNDNDFLTEALIIREICHRHNVLLIINDNINVAIKCKADGIHVGQKDMSVAEIRKKLNNTNMIIGVSAQTVEQAVKAEREGAGYLGVGSVFQTQTKTDANHVTYEILTKICSAVSIPVCAIGGITVDNIEKLRGSGINGVAVVSAIFSESDIQSASARLLKLSKEMVI